ncbi:hypothetical protein OG474_21205 [Kribbella sp. NBC_01505]|uniref:alpha/beta fold hydrolase n=1 Tax=Kribbella sp. NBC_01505 TaxID=2903580 RepID=UPI00386ED5C9
MAGGRIDGHAKALGFAYTTEELRESGMVNRYTVNMALAQNADHADTDLQRIDGPVGVQVGADDEVFDATKLAEFSRQAPHVKVTILPGETHLSLLDTAAAQVGPWLQSQSANGR